MKKLFATLVVSSLCALIAVAGAEKKPAAKIDGSWTVTSIIFNGKKLPKDVLDKASHRVAFKEGMYRETIKGKVNEVGTYKIDATQNPATIDFTLSEGEDKGKMQLGIFKVDGETLTIAMGSFGAKERPKNFDGAEKVGVMVFQRDK